MPTPVAILVIDVQNGLFAAPRPVYDGAAVVRRIRGLTDRAHDANVPVVYVQDKDVGPLGSAEWQLHSGLAPRPDDLVLQKAYADSFYQTALQAELAARGIRQLVIVGCKTDACVEMTCRRAVSLGYDVTLVSDGHTTSDNQFMIAPQSIAYYNRDLDGFGAEDGFGNGEHAISVCAADDIAF
jgi:nicotinamidase-related amidase